MLVREYPESAQNKDMSLYDSWLQGPEKSVGGCKPAES
jgi:hypothetical protein